MRGLEEGTRWSSRNRCKSVKWVEQARDSGHLRRGLLATGPVSQAKLLPGVMMDSAPW